MDDVSYKYGYDWDAAGNVNNVNYGADICGKRIYTLFGEYVDGTDTPWLTIDSTNGILSIQTDDDAHIRYPSYTDWDGNTHLTGYKVKIKTCLEFYPTRCEDFQEFEVEIHECKIVSFQFTETPKKWDVPTSTAVNELDMYHVIFSSDVTSATNNLLQVPDCGWGMTFTGFVREWGTADAFVEVTDVDADLEANFISLHTDVDPPTYEADSDLSSQEGYYEVKTVVNLNDTKYVDGGSETEISFKLVIDDPCHNSTINLQPTVFHPARPVGSHYHVQTSVKLGTDYSGLGTPATYDWNHHWDAASVTYMPDDGSKVCRERAYEFENLSNPTNDTDISTFFLSYTGDADAP